jgi:hypothetical protein
MYLMVYEKKIEELELDKVILAKKIEILEKIVDEQNCLIYNLKQTYYKIPDDEEGEASDYYD